MTLAARCKAEETSGRITHVQMHVHVHIHIQFVLASKQATDGPGNE